MNALLPPHNCASRVSQADGTLHLSGCPAALTSHQVLPCFVPPQSGFRALSMANRAFKVPSVGLLCPSLVGKPT